MSKYTLALGNFLGICLARVVFLTCLGPATAELWFSYYCPADNSWDHRLILTYDIKLTSKIVSMYYHLS
jgi:hypothetical protein